MMWLAQGYEPTYRTINRFRVNPAVQELLRQCFVQFRCQLVQEGLIEDEAIFIDGTKIEANANRFTFVWHKSIEKYSAALIEKSNQMYDGLLEKEITPGIERESLEELSDAVSERKQLRSQRKFPKKYHKLFLDMAKRK